MLKEGGRATKCYEEEEGGRGVHKVLRIGGGLPSAKKRGEGHEMLREGGWVGVTNTLWDGVGDCGGMDKTPAFYDLANDHTGHRCES